MPRRRRSGRPPAAGRGCPSRGCSSRRRQAFLPASEDLLEAGELQRHVVELRRAVVEPDVLEGEDHVELAPGRVGVEPRLLHGGPRHLPDRHERQLGGRAIGPYGLVHLAEELVSPGPVHEVRGAVTERTAGGGGCVHRPVGEPGHLGDEVDDVHPETVDPPVQPATHHRVHGVPDGGVLPVEVGLLAREEVEVVLAGRLVELPRRAGEEGLPVVRLAARRTGFEALAGRTPDIPVPLWVNGARARGNEPRVLV